MQEKRLNGSRSAVYLILMGLLVIALDIRLSTGIGYGFKIGDNSGLGNYLTTTVITLFTDYELMVDLLFDPLGYIFIFFGFSMLKEGQKSKKGKIFAIIGMISYVFMNLVPFMIGESAAMKAVVVLYAITVLSVAVIMIALTNIITSKVDNYTYQNIGKDLKFGVEVFAVCMVIKKILLLMSRAHIFFAAGLYYLVTVAGVLAMFYFAYKTWKYIMLMDL